MIWFAKSNLDRNPKLLICSSRPSGVQCVPAPTTFNIKPIPDFNNIQSWFQTQINFSRKYMNFFRKKKKFNQFSINFENNKNLIIFSEKKLILIKPINHQPSGFNLKKKKSNPVLIDLQNKTHHHSCQSPISNSQIQNQKP